MTTGNGNGNGTGTKMDFKELKKTTPRYH